MGCNYYLYINSDIDIAEIFKKSHPYGVPNVLIYSTDESEDQTEIETETETNTKNVPKLEEIHIGKTSLAGSYCSKCSKTLCKKGEYYIHYSDNEPAKWFDFCPSCGTDKLDVTVTCTFLWDIFPFELENAKKQATYFEIQNEGHEEFSYNKFLKIKNECIQNFENVGRNFE